MHSDMPPLVAPLDPSEEDWVLRLDQVGKRYRMYARPIDRVWELLGRSTRYRDFVALHPLSMTVRSGTALGIIGDNGAGKSTLMHLLAGSRPPSQGTLSRRGTVLGLLELGVGFHAEFSGRENVYFYGDVLGLERAAVKSRFDEIVAFAELGAFIDQPLRTYSTGMRMRLAFALVASLEPDILIVDEALAVGDMHFQKKCIDRMMEFRRAGKTIILCSHSLYHIGMFCDEVLWLQDGRIRMRDVPQLVLPAYEAYQLAKDVQADGAAGERMTGAPATIASLSVATPLPTETGEDLVFSWAVAAAAQTRYHLSFSLKMDTGRGVHVTGTHLNGQAALQGAAAGELRYPGLPLVGGVYSMHMRVWDDEGLILFDERVIDELVVRRDGRELGLVRLPCEFRVFGSGGAAAHGLHGAGRSDA
jgi:lipopolysaccharide transport system ATP-binding protein